MRGRTATVWVLIVVALWVVSQSVFTVSETQDALVTRFGRIVHRDLSAGLHLKSPLDDAYRFDRRLHSRTYPGEMLSSSDGRVLSVDFYLRWRIDDAVRYFNATGGDAAVASARIADVIRDRIKAAATTHTAAQLASSQRATLTDPIFAQANAAVAPLGVTMTDVELQRVDLPDEVAKAVYQRMQAGFNARAQQLRANGAAAADAVRSQADRKRAETLADGTREAARIRAEGDAAASATYARAYGRNPEFAAFYHSLAAYRDALGRDGDIFVISPDSGFFKYLRSASGR